MGIALKYWPMSVVAKRLDGSISNIVLDRDQLPPPKVAQQPPSFPHMSIVAKRSPISAAAEHL